MPRATYHVPAYIPYLTTHPATPLNSVLPSSPSSLPPPRLAASIHGSSNHSQRWARPRGHLRRGRRWSALSSTLAPLPRNRPPFSRARLTIYPLLNSQRTQAPPKRARSVPGVHCPISHSILGRLHLARIPLGRRGRRGPRPDRRPSAPRAPRAAHRRAGPLLPRLRARLRPRARLLRRAARAADDGLQPPCPRRLPRAREDPHGRVGRDGAAERVDRR